MQTLFAKKNLFLRVAIGFVLGVILGLAAPGFSIATKVVGDLYLNLIKMMIIPIVFCAVFCGIANIRDGALLRRIKRSEVIRKRRGFHGSKVFRERYQNASAVRVHREVRDRFVGRRKDLPIQFRALRTLFPVQYRRVTEQTALRRRKSDCRISCHAGNHDLRFHPQMPP